MSAKKNILKPYLSLILALSILTGCTSIHIQNAEEVKREWSFGITRMTITPDNRPVAINTQGVGLVTGYSSTTFGWLDEEVVVIPNPKDCHAIFINKTKEQTREILEILKAANTRLGNICFTSAPITK